MLSPTAEASIFSSFVLNYVQLTTKNLQVWSWLKAVSQWERQSSLVTLAKLCHLSYLARGNSWITFYPMALFITVPKWPKMYQKLIGQQYLFLLSNDGNSRLKISWLCYCRTVHTRHFLIYRIWQNPSLHNEILFVWIHLSSQADFFVLPTIYILFGQPLKVINTLLFSFWRKACSMVYT